MKLTELGRELRSLMFLAMAGASSAVTVGLTLTALTLSSPGAVPDLLPII